MTNATKGGLIGGGGGAALGAGIGALIGKGKGAAIGGANKFAASLLNNPQTDVQIYGHTDNVGTRAANEKVSNARATEVRNYLTNAGVPSARMTSKGLAYDYPVASNDTEAGRAQNRRVEIYITANEDMIKAAQDGTLN